MMPTSTIITDITPANIGLSINVLTFTMVVLIKGWRVEGGGLKVEG